MSVKHPVKRQGSQGKNGLREREARERRQIAAPPSSPSIFYVMMQGWRPPRTNSFIHSQ